MITAVLAAMVLFTDAAASVQTPPTNPAPAEATAAKPKSDANALVCRSEPTLGSRLPTKKCRTQAQMEARQLEDRQTIERAQIVPDPGH